MCPARHTGLAAAPSQGQLTGTHGAQECRNSLPQHQASFGLKLCSFIEFLLLWMVGAAEGAGWGCSSGVGGDSALLLDMCWLRVLGVLVLINDCWLD